MSLLFDYNIVSKRRDCKCICILVWHNAYVFAYFYKKKVQFILRGPYCHSAHAVLHKCKCNEWFDKDTD